MQREQEFEQSFFIADVFSAIKRERREQADELAAWAEFVAATEFETFRNPFFFAWAQNWLSKSLLLDDKKFGKPEFTLKLLIF